MFFKSVPKEKIKTPIPNTSAAKAGQTLAKSPVVTGIKDYGEYFLEGLKGATQIPVDFFKGLFGG